MALCLNQLLSNRRSSPFILINDSIQFSGLPLLTEFAASTLRENHTLIVVLTETSPEAWATRVQHQQSSDNHTTTSLSNKSKIYIIDAYTDPLGWDDLDQVLEATAAQKGSDAPFVLKRVHDIRDMERSILKPIIEKMPAAGGSGNNTNSECTILIDSVHPLLMISQQRTYQLVKALESLTTDTIRLVIGHHADIELPRNKNSTVVSTVDALNRLASVILSLEPLPERTMYDAAQEALTGFTAQESFTYMKTTSNLVEKGGLARIEWRKKSGKVQYETNGFYLGSKGNLIVVEPSQLMGGGNEAAEVSMDVEELGPQQQKQPDPMANLSFNLSLTDNQRRAKDNVELPFMKVQEQQQPSGHIYYEPDAGDDFDDEDPDDDLDI